LTNKQSNSTAQEPHRFVIHQIELENSRSIFNFVQAIIKCKWKHL